MPNRDKVLVTQAALSLLGFLLMVGIAAKALRSVSETDADQSGQAEQAELDRSSAVRKLGGPSLQLNSPFKSPLSGQTTDGALHISRASHIAFGPNAAHLGSRGSGRERPDLSGAGGFAEPGVSTGAIMTGTIVKRGSELVLLDSSGKVFYLDLPDRAQQFEGAKVRVRGTLAASNQLRITELVPAGMDE